jgi:Polysulphide reductase, NrfD
VDVGNPSLLFRWRRRFVGGAAGAAAVIGAIADYTGADRKLVRDARWIAAAGSIISISPTLLIADLGRPERFLSMLRVFKPRSPMSVGVWTLVGFSSGAVATAFAGHLRIRYGPSLPLRILENAGQAASLAFGLPFSNYTGVLIGATTIPVWNRNAGNLPLHFGASGLSAAVGVLELLGHRKNRALQALGLGAALFEVLEGTDRNTGTLLACASQIRCEWPDYPRWRSIGWPDSSGITDCKSLGIFAEIAISSSMGRLELLSRIVIDARCMDPCRPRIGARLESSLGQ